MFFFFFIFMRDEPIIDIVLAANIYIDYYIEVLENIFKLKLAFNEWNWRKYNWDWGISGFRERMRESCGKPETNLFQYGLTQKIGKFRSKSNWKWMRSNGMTKAFSFKIQEFPLDQFVLLLLLLLLHSITSYLVCITMFSQLIEAFYQSCKRNIRLCICKRDIPIEPNNGLKETTWMNLSEY